jgi:hypothetical protein
MDITRVGLRDVLLDARALIAWPDNNFDWSSWSGLDAALREIDGLVATLERGRVPSRLAMSVLFAPTGPIQEVSISSGWAEEFLALAERFDAAAEAFYSHGPGWRRLMNWRLGGLPSR